MHLSLALGESKGTLQPRAGLLCPWLPGVHALIRAQSITPLITALIGTCMQAAGHGRRFSFKHGYSPFVLCAPASQRGQAYMGLRTRVCPRAWLAGTPPGHTPHDYDTFQPVVPKPRGCRCITPL